MSAPHVAGLAALALVGSPAATPAQVASLLQTAATTATVTDAGTGSPNLLAYTGVGTITTPPTPLTSVAVGALSGKGIEMERYWLASVAISASGKCSLNSGLLTSRTAQTVFRVSGITGTNLRHDATKNVAGSVTVRKP